MTKNTARKVALGRSEYEQIILDLVIVWLAGEGEAVLSTEYNSASARLLARAELLRLLSIDDSPT